MSDLTDSYCERCGARYVFGPPMPKTLSLKGARLLAKGLKNFVLTDGQSMADSLTLARNEDSHVGSARITEAFHRTFNFCMTCRQYACDRCWNSRVGACLSCSPESGNEAVAPEDHMIVRTPVARWDTDWSLFPDGPAVEPLVRPAPPEPFNAPIRFSEAETAAVASAAAETAAPPAWPASDLQPDASAVPTVQGGRNGNRAHRKPVDPAAASLWPMADEIAPEMTLTPEELELVEFKLARSDAPVQFGHRGSRAQEPQTLPAPPVLPPANEVHVEEPVKRAGWPSAAAAWPAADAPAPEPDPPKPEVPTLAAPPAPEVPFAKDIEAPTPPQHVLEVPAAAQMAPQTPAWSPPHLPEPSHEHTPIVGRLLGRHYQQIETRADAESGHLRGRKAQPGPDPWPHVTPWSDRPVRNQDWSGEAAAANEAVAANDTVAPPPAALAAATAPSAVPMAAIAQPVAEPEPQAPWLTPHQIDPHLVDARSAAAVRLSAVLAGETQPGAAAELAPAADDAAAWVSHQPVQSVQPVQRAQPVHPVAAAYQAPAEPAQRPVQPPLFDLQPDLQLGRRSDIPEPPAWPQTGPIRRLNRDNAPTAPWQPLGSSWPAPANPSSSWTASEMPSVLSVVAAQQAAEPTVTEMWAQSSQEVLNRGTVRVCHRCALPVSTQARFCRRCGTEQG